MHNKGVRTLEVPSVVQEALSDDPRSKVAVVRVPNGVLVKEKIAEAGSSAFMTLSLPIATVVHPLLREALGTVSTVADSTVEIVVGFVDDNFSLALICLESKQ